LAGVFAVLTCVCEELVNPLSLPAAKAPLHLPLRLAWLIAFYPAKIIWPTNLSSVYMLPDPLSLANPTVVLAVGAAIALIVAVLVSRRFTPAIWVGAAVYYLGLAPTMGFVGYSWVVASDKYAYLPAVGLLLILAWLLDRLASGGSTAARARWVGTVAAVCAVAALLGVATRQYLRQWKDSDILIHHMYALAPNSPQLNNDMGSHLIRQGRYDEAIFYIQKALELQPNFALPYYSRGWIEAVRNRPDHAIENYRKALAIHPRYVDAYNGLVNAYQAKDEWDQALTYAKTIIELEPDNHVGYELAGRNRMQQRKPDQALPYISKAVELNPRNAETRTVLGDALARTGNPDAAAKQYRKALDLQPDLTTAHFRLAGLLVDQNRPADAVPHYARAIQTQTRPSPRVDNELAWTLAANNLEPPAGIPDAVALATRACEQTQYRQAATIDTLAVAYARAGRFAEAVAMADKAVEVALTQGQTALADAIRARRDLFAAGRPYDETPSGTVGSERR
ncbi:MAG TPA: tetratricopeptide repeat protein, partial [Phycisphaerae bacterium]|nr:tetratricopeptide repeat protein [Phycisphaerae bacterium]